MQPSSKMLPSAIHPRDFGDCRFGFMAGSLGDSNAQRAELQRPPRGWPEVQTAFVLTRFLV